MASLAEELLAQSDVIVNRWYEAWRKAAHHRPEVGEAALKDHLPAQLRLIASELQKGDKAEPPNELWKHPERLDPENRVLQEVPIEEVVLEHGLLVDVVRKWLEEQQIEVPFRDYSYFFQAVFELVAESVRRYSTLQASQVAKQRGQYLAGVMHQLRTPVATLSLEIQLLRGGRRLPDMASFDRMHRSIRRIEAMVGVVMRLERFKPDELPVRPETVRPSELVNDVMTDHDADAARKQLRFEALVNRSLEMQVDPMLFLDALGNLVHNAVKYTASGFVRIELVEEPESLLFKIIYSGPGIPAERQHHLFEQVKPGTGGGVGIGLLVAHHAVVAQGGEIGVESEPGKGSTFWFRLPRQVKARGETTLDEE